jgi:hypothetical protein
MTITNPTPDNATRKEGRKAGRGGRDGKDGKDESEERRKERVGVAAN